MMRSANPMSSMRTTQQFTLSAILLVAISGCKVGPNYAPPQTKTAESWSTQDQAGIKPGAEPVTQWWKTLNDPTLDSLVERAAAQNLDVKVAAAKVKEARAQRGIVAADRWPTVNANGQYERRRISQEALSESGGTFSGP